jgi:hypothetical protein
MIKQKAKVVTTVMGVVFSLFMWFSLDEQMKFSLTCIEMGMKNGMQYLHYIVPAALAISISKFLMSNSTTETVAGGNSQK